MSGIASLTGLEMACTCNASDDVVLIIRRSATLCDVPRRAAGRRLLTEEAPVQAMPQCQVVQRALIILPLACE